MYQNSNQPKILVMHTDNVECIIGKKLYFSYQFYFPMKQNILSAMYAQNTDLITTNQ